jgi:hypothetical protein
MRQGTITLTPMHYFAGSESYFVQLLLCTEFNIVLLSRRSSGRWPVLPLMRGFSRCFCEYKASRYAIRGAESTKHKHETGNRQKHKAFGGENPYEKSNCS